MVSTYDLRTHYCFSNKLLSVFLGLFLLPVSRAVHAKNRRYSFPEYREYLAKLNFTPDLASNSTGKIIIPVTVPFVEGLTEVSFSKYKICSDECDSLLVNVTDTCDGCLVKHQRGSYTHMARWQLSADVLIALAYFSIPVELLFFLYKMRMFPYKLVVAEFGIFIILCGLTHIITLWTFLANSKASFGTMTFFKCITAVVSCATAVTLFQVIPELLSVKTREIFLTIQAAELGKEVGKIKKQEEIGRHVRLLTLEIRSTLDRHTILHTTLVETARTLQLTSCGIWMPNLSEKSVELTYSVETHAIAFPLSVPMSDEIVQKVFNSSGALVIPSDCPLAKLTVHMASDEEMPEGHVAAVRLPLLHTTDFNQTGNVDVVTTGADGALSLMVLALPKNEDRLWGNSEMDLLNSVVDQVAVALSHATVVEESMRARDQLMVQNAQLQEARQEVEQAMAARNEFLAVMNHEMRTPMHAIIALASLLLESGLTPDQRAMVETMNKSSGLLQTLIDDVLDFSKLEVGKLTLDPTPFELTSLFKEAENILRPMATNKQIGFEWKLKDVPEKILGDSKRILQILLNVIGNAIKFTSSGYVHVTVHMGEPVDVQPTGLEQAPTPTKRRSLKLKYRYLHVKVEDTGVGISPENVGLLFNKFVQADSSTTRKFGGTGLGLAICKKFVELMRGTIAINSEGIGKGSMCTFSLCVGVISDELEESNSPRRQSVQEGSLIGIKVLVVDDNAINRMVTSKLLRTLGCEATVLESGPECIQKLAEVGPSGFDIVLLDLCMPEMDGFMVAEEIIKTYGNKKRPLISALTANADTRTREKCFETGMDSILLKPISLGKLKTDLLRLVQHARDFDTINEEGESSGTDDLLVRS
ncbi:hypothetical protein AXG93_2931s1320 [Marchantia polymorpha subsp. ruderalis]|uniref:histidine kinase n=2 Tax=Marchantia polymorpha TaxID=3197 RepID=A0A176VVR1_MARPO|nr:hypothetical protein AXG93_2931s1320 [Marchantia polymorpha subsp. ruderalis]